MLEGGTGVNHHSTAQSIAKAKHSIEQAVSECSVAPSHEHAGKEDRDEIAHTMQIQGGR